MELTNKTGYVLLLKSNKKLNQNDMNLACFSKESHVDICKMASHVGIFETSLVSPEKNLVILVSLDIWLLSFLLGRARFPWDKLNLVILVSLEIDL